MRKEYSLNLRGENDVSEKRFSTDDIVATVMKWRGWDMDAVDEPAYKEIIARLRAADRLCEAATTATDRLEYWGLTRPIHNGIRDALRKAIADYKGKE